jgi:hypothetical protein
MTTEQPRKMVRFVAWFNNKFIFWNEYTNGPTGATGPMGRRGITLAEYRAGKRQSVDKSK